MKSNKAITEEQYESFFDLTDFASSNLSKAQSTCPRTDDPSSDFSEPLAYLTMARVRIEQAIRVLMGVEQ